MTFNFGKPVDYTETILVDSVYTLEQFKYNYAVVQVQDPNKITTDPTEIATYNRQGIAPTQFPSANGFIAGKNDTIVFSVAELREGVKFINITNGENIRLAIQYYNNIQP